jgi:hypothetical protein
MIIATDWLCHSLPHICPVSPSSISSCLQIRLTWVPWRILLVDQQLLTLPVPFSSLPVFNAVRVARSFAFCFLWTIVCPFILFFFYQMYRLSIFDSWLLIISVVLYPKTFILSYPSIIILSLSVIDKSPVWHLQITNRSVGNHHFVFYQIINQSLISHQSVIEKSSVHHCEIVRPSLRNRQSIIENSSVHYWEIVSSSLTNRQSII